MVVIHCWLKNSSDSCNVHAIEKVSSVPEETFQLNTTSDPTQVHLAHQDQIELSLNGKALLYRKDWRLVNRRDKGHNQLSILLHQPMRSDAIAGSLTIGKNSNIGLSDINFAQHACNPQHPSQQRSS